MAMYPQVRTAAFGLCTVSPDPDVAYSFIGSLVVVVASKMKGTATITVVNGVPNGHVDVVLADAGKYP